MMFDGLHLPDSDVSFNLDCGTSHSWWIITVSASSLNPRWSTCDGTLDVSLISELMDALYILVSNLSNAFLNFPAADLPERGPWKIHRTFGFIVFPSNVKFGPVFGHFHPSGGAEICARSARSTRCQGGHAPGMFGRVAGLPSQPLPFKITTTSRQHEEDSRLRYREELYWFTCVSVWRELMLLSSMCVHYRDGNRRGVNVWRLTSACTDCM